MNAAPAACGVGLRNVTDLFALVDDLGSEATGEIAIAHGDQLRGSVFVERGRVCWAAARGLSQRLSELLGARASLPRARMESFYLACRRENVPLGEHLVGRGVLAAQDLEEALLQHTAESLASLAGSPVRGVWSPRAGKGYSPRFTFTTAELFARIGAGMHAVAAARARPSVASHFADGAGVASWGAAFVRDAASASPALVALCGEAPPAATIVLRVGRWATSALDLAATFSGDGALVATTRAMPSGPRSLVAFRCGDAVVAGETSEQGTARILNRRAEARRAGGEDRGDL